MISFFSDMLDGFVVEVHGWSRTGLNSESRLDFKSRKVWGISSLFLNRLPPTTLWSDPGRRQMPWDFHCGYSDPSVHIWPWFGSTSAGRLVCMSDVPTGLPACSGEPTNLYTEGRRHVHNKAALTSAISRRFDGWSRFISSEPCAPAWVLVFPRRFRIDSPSTVQ